VVSLLGLWRPRDARQNLLFSLVNVLENVTVHEPQTKNPQGLWSTLLYRIAYPQKVGCARGHGATPPRICSPSHKKQLTVSITPNVAMTGAFSPPLDTLVSL